MKTSSQTPTDLYEEDFYSWTQTQAALLKAGLTDEADLANIIEEIETLGRSELDALRSRYAVLCAHVLKSVAQPHRRGRSWDLTMTEQRIQIARLLEDNPGLNPKRSTLFTQGYQDGRKLAAAETGMAISTFPATPSFTMDQAEDEDWRP